jgi:hemerythrin-like domain-containing protein
MRPTEVLMHEHRVIEQVIACLEEISNRCEAGQALDTISASEAIDFFRVFADRCHHGKEEDLLFPAMEEKGFSREQGPTGVMLREHDAGRFHVDGMSKAIERVASGDVAAREAFIEHAREFAALLRQHIVKEDHCLFPMADRALSAADQDALSRSFAKVEHDDLGKGVHEKYVGIADQLAERYGIAKSTAPSAAGIPCGAHAVSGNVR